MASQSFNLIGQEEEELIAFGTRQSRGPTPLSRPNSRMEEMLSQLIILQDATAKSIAENTRSQEALARSLEAKVSALAQSHTSTDDKLSHITYKQIEQIAEMSDLVDRISTVERSLQGSSFTGSDPTRRILTPPRLALERSKPAKSSDLLPPLPLPFRRSLRLQMKQNPTLYRTDSRFLNSPVEEEEEEEEVGFRPLRVKHRPIDKGSVDATQGQRLRVVEMGENLVQERIIEYHAVGPEVQGIQTTVEALFPIERIGVAPGVSAGLASQHHTPSNALFSSNRLHRPSSLHQIYSRLSTHSQSTLFP